MTIPEPETPQPVVAEEAAQPPDKFRQIIISAVAIIVGILILGSFGYFIYYLAFRSETSVLDVERIRDIFIIVMALESLIIGMALIILIVQVASLINLLRNEVRPILDATNETVNHLRGTSEFLGETVVEPVVKLNTYLAGMNRMLELLGVKKK